MHMTQSTLLALLQGRLDEEDATDIMGHLAFCDDCALRLAALRRVRENFDESWQTLLNEFSTEHGDALAEDSGTQRVMAFAVRILLDTHRRVAAVGTQLVREFVPADLGLRLELNLGYGGIGDAERPPEIEKLRTEAAKQCGEGAYDRASETLRRVSSIHPDAAEVGDAKGTAAGGIPVEVMVDASRGVVSVLAHVQAATGEDRPSSPERLRAVLLQPDGTVLRKEPFEEVEGADYWLAEFESVPDGRFVVGVDYT